MAAKMLSGYATITLKAFEKFQKTRKQKATLKGICGAYPLGLFYVRIMSLPKQH